MNALIMCLNNDETWYVNRSALDFLQNHLPLVSDYNSFEENVRLVEAGLLAT